MMYILRLDDASEHWNRENWVRIHDILMKYKVQPIVAIIPNNEDGELLKYPLDPLYSVTIKDWIKEGWIPALHGYNHVCSLKSGGFNPIHESSEFAGLSLSQQREKIRKGYTALEKSGIYPQIFVAPKHTLDENTLIALKYETTIRIVSDTIARDAYYRDGFYFLPQQTGKVRKLPLPLVTFCYHPNVMTESSFQDLDQFIKINKELFGSFDKISLKQRHYDFLDSILQSIYFTVRKIRRFYIFISNKYD